MIEWLWELLQTVWNYLTGRPPQYDRNDVTVHDEGDAPGTFTEGVCRKMAEINRRQAYVIEGAEVLPNDRGTAPGLWISLDSGTVIMLLPGPPRELKSIFPAECLPRIEIGNAPLVAAQSLVRVGRADGAVEVAVGGALATL